MLRSIRETVAARTPRDGEHSKAAEARRRFLPPAGGEVVAEGGETGGSSRAAAMAPGECGGATECRGVGPQARGDGQSAPGRRPRCRYAGWGIAESSRTSPLDSRLVRARGTESTGRLSRYR